MSTDQNDEKLHQILEKIYPLLLDRLKNEGIFQQKTGPKPNSPSFNPEKYALFLPEVDYFIRQCQQQRQLRQCGFTASGEVRTPNHKDSYDWSNPWVGFDIQGKVQGTWQHHVYIPSATLKADVSAPYDTNYSYDYRVKAGARTVYMPGVMDRTKGNLPSKRNLSVRIINWTAPIDREVIDATRVYWESMPDDGGNSIVTKATMMDLLDRMELGEFVPGQIPWRVDLSNSGQAVNKPMTEAYVDSLITPKKISIAKG
jgi:hypothetical protein